MPGGFPDEVRVSLLYTEDFTISATGVTVQDQVCSGNSVFDPNVTGTGLQPACFDDWATQYNRYRVNGSRAVVEMFPLGSGTGTGAFEVALCARVASTAVTSLSGFDDAIVQPRAKHAFVNTNAGVNIVTSMNVTTPKIFGLDHAAFVGGDDTESAVSTNPVIRWYWHTLIKMADASSAGLGYFRVTVTYDVTFYSHAATGLDLTGERIQRMIQAKRDREAAYKARKLQERRAYAALIHINDEDPPGWLAVREHKGLTLSRG